MHSFYIGHVYLVSCPWFLEAGVASARKALAVAEAAPMTLFFFFLAGVIAAILGISGSGSQGVHCKNSKQRRDRIQARSQQA